MESDVVRLYFELDTPFVSINFTLFPPLLSFVEFAPCACVVVIEKWCTCKTMD